MKKRVMLLALVLMLSSFVGCSSETNVTKANEKKEFSEGENSQETNITETTKISEVTETEASFEDEELMSFKERLTPVEKELMFWADSCSDVVFSDYNVTFTPDEGTSDGSGTYDTNGESRNVCVVDFDGNSIPELCVIYLKDGWTYLSCYYVTDSEGTGYTRVDVIEDLGIDFDSYTIYESIDGERYFVFDSTLSGDGTDYDVRKASVAVKFTAGAGTYVPEVEAKVLKYRTYSLDEDGLWYDHKYYDTDGNEIDETEYYSSFVGDLLFPDKEYKIFEVDQYGSTIDYSERYSASRVYGELFYNYLDYLPYQVDKPDAESIITGEWTIDESSESYSYAVDNGLDKIVFTDGKVQFPNAEDNTPVDYDILFYYEYMLVWDGWASDCAGFDYIGFNYNQYNELLNVYVVNEDGSFGEISLFYTK